MSQELLRLHNAQVRREGRVILSIDDFVIEQGDCVVLVGPNGAGKSTLVKLLTREVMPLWREEPPVLFRGNPRPLLADVQRTVGIVSTTAQDRTRYHVPVFDVVIGGFFGSIGVPHHRTATEGQIAAAHRALAEIGIDGLAERDMLTLSSGQARRALIARALIHAPQVLVFDEPCTGLDPEAVWNLRQTLSRLAQSGRTILLVTHDIADIMPEFTRVVMLKDAHIVADDAKAELLTTEKMRELFGVPITVVEQDGRYTLY